MEDEQPQDAAPEQPSPASDPQPPADPATDDPGPIGHGPAFRGLRPEDSRGWETTAQDDPGPIGRKRVAEGDRGASDD